MKVRAKRSLKAKVEGLERANKAVMSFASKMDLAAELEISRATVQNFFAGKPIGRENFHKICEKLQLAWQEIAEMSDSHESPATAPNKQTSATLVQQLRQIGSAKLQQRCGFMRVLDMSQPLALSEIYTNVNILEKISGRRRLEIAELLKVSVAEEFDHPGLQKTAQAPVLGLEAVQTHSKLIVLGKPGAGKTTFLKHIALECDRGQLQAERLPIFISLKDYGDSTPHLSLLEYISEQFASSTSSGNYSTAIEQICRRGQALVLLDGLDEVRDSDSYRVVQAVRHFTAKYHLNHYVISCRLATREYTLEEFTEVEVADFSAAQISSFTNKWFASKDPSQSCKFLAKLQQQRAIQELVTNPLLLTLLCLVFAESGDFPANRAELYKEGLSVLLRKWDAKRNIEREQIYKKLSVQHKEELLSQIAYSTFERGDYFFRQKELEQQIAAYIRNILSVNRQAEALQVDSEAVLKSIEAQHGLLVERARGIYSFSHLTFQEYFTARKIVATSDPQRLEEELQQLAQRVAEPRWHEVFLLSVGMLRHGDYLLQLMKQQIDQLLAAEPQLQALLVWLSCKASSVNARYRLVTLRAFYLDLDVARVLDLMGGTLDLARSFDRDFTRALDCEIALDLALDRALALNHIIDTTHNLALSIHRVIARAVARAHVVDPELESALQQLKQHLPDSTQDAKGFEQWWQAHGAAWTEQLRAVAIAYRHLGQDWQLSQQQKQALKQYYYANQLLVDCLNSNCYVTTEVRQELEDTLLLPSSLL